MDIGTALSLALVGLMIYHFVKRRGGPLVHYVVSLFVYQPVNAPRPRSNDVQARSTQQEAEKDSVQRSNVQEEPPGFVPPTIEELRMLAEAIAHNVKGQTKQAAIEEAFGVTKGGSAGWRRASQLFDAALGLDRV